MKKENKKKKLKGFKIKTKILIEEIHERYKTGSTYEQPFECYVLTIRNSHGTTVYGTIQSKDELIKRIQEEFIK